MDFRDFKTGSDDVGRRLDKVIRIFIPDAALTNIYKSLRKGLIKVNGAKVKPDYRINENDVIQIASFLAEQGTPALAQVSKSGKNIPVLDKKWIVFENEHILILNKPAGINVHSAQKDEVSLQELVLAYYNSKKNNDSLSFKPGPLHRIDKYTQGLVCFSMSTPGAQWFSKNMAEHNIKKTYLAVVEGKVEKSELWTDRIEKLEDKEEGFHTSVIDQNADKECITKITPLEVLSSSDFVLTRAQFDIQTGRHHQIRAQSAFHGHPLYGDTAYGGHKTKDNKGQFYLAACRIEFPQNDLGIPQKIELFPEI